MFCQTSDVLKFHHVQMNVVHVEHTIMHHVSEHFHEKVTFQNLYLAPRFSKTRHEKPFTDT